MKTINDYSLYFVASQEYNKNKASLQVAEEAIGGGIDILQMREKHMETPELIELGTQLSTLCSRNNVTFIVNDDPFIAKKVDADGVHLGQEDLKEYPIDKTRDIIGDDKIIGISTHSVDEFLRADKSSCNYIAFGPIFPTKTKDYSIGTEEIDDLITVSRKPVIFIGGIDLGNIDQILSRGGKIIGLIRAIMQAKDIKSQVTLLKEKIYGYREKNRSYS